MSLLPSHLESLAVIAPLALALCALLPSGEGAAPAPALELPAVFGDGMVLQRDQPLPVWGRARPGSAVTVELAGASARGLADAQGDWRVDLPPLAAGGPFELRVVGDGELVLEDVWLGEVWLGAGQSNMAMTVSVSADYEGVAAAADVPGVRWFREETSPPSDEPAWRGAGEWTVCAPDTVGECSAVMYHHARELHRELGVPVGIVQTAVGGTPIESWISPRAQREDAQLAEHVRAWSHAYENVDIEASLAEFELDLAAWERKAAAAERDGGPRPPKPFCKAELVLRAGDVGGLFNAKVAPLVPYAVRGVIWYQGEANYQRPELYQHQLELLVADWRAQWDAPELPFAWVQLPGYALASGWSELREGQRRALRVPHTGMAVSIDVGEHYDIHPPRKAPVGRRLGAWALASVYGLDVPAGGPRPVRVERRARALVLRFADAAGGLVARDGAPRGFELRGEDGVWRRAQARVGADCARVRCPEIPRPTAVRYGWGQDPDCNLFDAAGLPAATFVLELQPEVEDAPREPAPEPRPLVALRR